ncbi:LOW QUALITY PROTEIN: Protein CBG08769 [Caenorhabditis briggsae]|uniref:Protein CBG08769 n=1 Tax=Caenorhabditis briggsae TaxID=6238 RepID=A8X7C7_CAEBR|nr:LOW QUALITY PROTEIN: Protein CBG08769 [Caenorhabditis briggsae]CAP28538.1 Protein CBG08769 [Caenorhabditis briggsae]
MRRADYDQVPNRIIPPQGSALDPRYERSARILPAPTIRQPLLGNAPPQVASYANGYESAYNNYNMDPSRRRGFDKGPLGEDLRRVDGHRPLMRNPRLAVEHVGGDMDISRSRSPSPEVQVIKARSVRDDRKKYRGDSSRRRSRSRSRSPSRSDRGDRDHRRAPNPLRMDRDDYDRERVNSRYEDPPPQIRDGIVHTSENYFDFLMHYVDTLHDQLQVSRGNAPVVRRMNMTITEASPLEKKTIVLPPIFDDSDRERMLHCDTTIAGLPTSIFYGSGYGPRVHYAKYSAAKDLIDKCHRIGVLSSVLYAAIGDFERVDNDFKVRFANHISKAVNAVILLIQRMTTVKLLRFLLNKKLEEFYPRFSERRKVDNAMCLFTYFEQIPWALMGGMTMIPEASVRKLLPPESIYNAWRCQFFQSLQYLLPQMIFSRIARFVDRGDWCTEVITGEQFREVIQRVRKAKLNPMYTILWTTKPTDFDPRNQQFANARSALIRQMEAEVKSLWTYETIGMYLKMYF